MSGVNGGERADHAEHALVVEARKAFRYEFVHARRWHHHAIKTLDALNSVMQDEVNSVDEYADAGEKLAIIEKARAELVPYFARPLDNDA